MSVTSRWAKSLAEAGTPESLLKSWEALQVAIATHQKLLAENGIGKEVSERDRVRVNARRVGLEAPPFADEVEATFSDILTGALRHRASAKERAAEEEKEVAAKA